MREPQPGHRPRRFRLVVAGAALVFAAATLVYSVAWMLAVRYAPDVPPVELGFDLSYDSAGRVFLVTRILRGSPAEAAGMLAQDRIIAIEGRRVEAQSSLYAAYRRYRPGDAIELTVLRSGHAAPLRLNAVFRARPRPLSDGGLTGQVADEVRNFYPVPFVAVGLTILFLRLEDRRVWLVALLLAGFTAAPGIPGSLEEMAPSLLPFAVAYRAVFLGLLGALFYWFFAIFPTRSPLDLRVPWLKWAGLAMGIAAGPSGLWVGDRATPALAPLLLGRSLAARVGMAYEIAFLTLGLVSLAANAWRIDDPQARRRIRVIFWGGCIGVAPSLFEAVARDYFGFRSPDWLSAVLVAILFLFPLSFAYAVVKHRVLDIPVLLKRSARYLLVQRGFTILLALASIGLTLAFALSLARYFRPVIEAAEPAGVGLGAMFGTALLWGGSHVHRRVSGRIDRAFFRGSYDARVILEQLAEKTRGASDRGELARLLERQVRAALQPRSLYVYLEAQAGRLMDASGGAPLPAIDCDLPAVAAAAQHGRPSEFAGAPGSGLEALEPECLAPILARDGRLAGLLVLGARLSEEPYSGDDRRLLALVANQAGAALDNIRLAETIAERMEAERRTAREMEIAKDVQARLLPGAAPRLDTVEFAARCIQARAVGGDYFDFLALGAGRAAFVLADVSGKGVHAALLMANLQAHLRSQTGIAPLEPARMLERVNRLLWQSTAAQHYATLFFGVYDDATRELAYINCGHNPALLLRADGIAESLSATATVLGLFERWECREERVTLAPGDLLAVFSDGVVEAPRGDDEFGEARLTGLLAAHRRMPAAGIVAEVLAQVQAYSAGAQYDDLTLLIARSADAH